MTCTIQQLGFFFFAEDICCCKCSFNQQFWYASILSWPCMETVQKEKQPCKMAAFVLQSFCQQRIEEILRSSLTRTDGKETFKNMKKNESSISYQFFFIKQSISIPKIGLDHPHFPLPYKCEKDLTVNSQVSFNLQIDIFYLLATYIFIILRNYWASLYKNLHLYLLKHIIEYEKASIFLLNFSPLFGKKWNT